MFSKMNKRETFEQVMNKCKLEVESSYTRMVSSKTLSSDQQEFLNNINEVRQANVFVVQGEGGEEDSDLLTEQEKVDALTQTDEVKEKEEPESKGFLMRMYEKVFKKPVVSLFESFSAFSTWILDNIFKPLIHFFKIDVVFGWLKDMLKPIYTYFSGFKMIGKLTTILWNIFKILCVFLLVMILLQLGIFTFSKLIDFIKQLCFKENEIQAVDMIAQGDPISVAGAVLLAQGVDNVSLNRFINHSRTIITCAAGVGLIVTLGRGLLMILPAFLKGLFFKYLAPKATAIDYYAREWTERSKSIMSMSKLNNVLHDKEFSQIVHEHLKSAAHCCDAAMSQGLRTQFSAYYVKIVNLSTSLATAQSSGARNEPFCIHITAAPGVGKTLVKNRLLADVLRTDAYHRGGEEYWNGYRGQDTIVFDEFLSGTSDLDAKIESEFLLLVSSSEYMPNMASIDNADIGIKGTRADPKYVITMGNARYPNLQQDLQAVCRRRKVVLEVTVDKKYVSCVKNSQLDMNAVIEKNPKAFDTFEHLNFQFLPPINPGVQETQSDLMKWDSVVPIVKEKMDMHARVGAKINSGVELRTSKEARRMAFKAFYTKGPLSNFSLDGFTSMIGSFASKFGLGSQLEAQMDTNQVCSKDAPKEVLSSNARVFTPSVKASDPEVIESPSTSRTDLAQAPPPKKEEPEGEKPSTSWTGRTQTYSSKNSGSRDSRSANKKRLWAEQMQDPQWEDMTSNQKKQYRKYRASQRKVPENRQMQSLSPVVSDISLSKHVSKPKVESDTSDSDSLSSFTSAEDSLLILGKSRKIKDVELMDKQSGLSIKVSDLERAGKQTIESKAKTDMKYMSVLMKGEMSQSSLFRLHQAALAGVQYDASKLKTSMSAQIYDEGWAKKLTTCTSSDVMYYSAVGIMLYVVAKVFAGLFGNEEPLVEQSDIPDSKIKPAKRNDVSKLGFKPMLESQAFDLRKSMVKMVLNGITAWGLALCNNIVVTFKHFLIHAKAEEGDLMRVFWNDREYEVPWTLGLTYSNDANEAILISLVASGNNPKFANIMKKLVTSNEVAALSACSIKIYTHDNRLLVGTGTYDTSATYTMGGTNYRPTSNFRARIDTKQGDCGSPVVVASGPLMDKIIGIHVAGSKGGIAPLSLAAVISRDGVLEAISSFKRNIEPISDVEAFNDGVEQIGLASCEKCPVLSKKEYVSREEQVHVPARSKLCESALSPWIPYMIDKQPAILSKQDGRSGGVCPLDAFVDSLERTKVTKIPIALLEKAQKSQYRHLVNNLQWPEDRCPGTIDEGALGIPGVMQSLSMTTSPGYPFCYGGSKGKSNFFSYDGVSEYIPTEDFYFQVSRMREMLRERDFSEIRWVAYLKDELVRQEKIDKVTTRVIFSGNVILNAIYRAELLPFIVACNKGSHNTFMAIGMNAYSYDMNILHGYLNSIAHTGFYDGDLKKFDRSMQEDTIKMAYRTIQQLVQTYMRIYDHHLLSILPNVMCDTPMMVKNQLLYAPGYNKSGNILTTIINCFVHDLYQRVCFYDMHPDLDYDRYVKCKILGDDNIWTSAVLSFNGATYQELMLKIGQEYVDPQNKDSKKRMSHQGKDFEECTFLGSQPNRIGPQYVGIPLIESLMHALKYTRDSDKTMMDKIAQVMQWVSLRDEEFFTTLSLILVRFFDSQGLTYEMSDYQTERKSQAARSCSGGLTGFVAQGEGEGGSLTGFHSTALRGTTATDNIMSGGFACSVNEKPSTLDYGPSSFIYRETVEWKTSHAVGQIVGTYQVPEDLLLLGNTDNVQNMPFDRFIWWHGNVSVKFVVNGMPFQQGVLMAAFRPLKEEPLGVVNSWNLDHVLLQPTTSGEVIMDMPYRFYRNVMNTLAIHKKQEKLGVLYLIVVNKLQVGTGSQNSVSVSLFTKFPNSQFTVPRPLGLTVRTKREVWSRMVSVPALGLIREDSQVELEEQGANVSRITNNTNQTVQVERMMGEMPVVSSPRGAPSQKNEANPNLSIPMDKTPIASGSAPMFPIFSGMCKGIGIDPTTGLQVHPGAMYRTSPAVFGVSGDEANIEWLCSKRCLISSATWRESHGEGEMLFESKLHPLVHPDFKSDGRTVAPLFAQIADLFNFWRADIEVTIIVAKTPFHSGRLLWVTGYGYPSVPTYASCTGTYTQVLDFSKDQLMHSFLIPYNAQTTFLRNFEGDQVANPVQDYTMGFGALYVLNQLRSNTSVANSVEVNVLMALKNTHFHYPRDVRFTYGNMFRVTRGTPSRRKRDTKESEQEEKKDSKNEMSLPKLLGETQHMEMRKQLSRIEKCIDSSSLIHASQNLIAAKRALRGQELQEVEALFKSLAAQVEKRQGERTKLEAQGETIADAVEQEPVQKSEQSVTAEVSCHPVPPSQKLAVGEHFEYHMQSLVEIGRRYTAVSGIDDTYTNTNDVTTADLYEPSDGHVGITYKTSTWWPVRMRGSKSHYEKPFNRLFSAWKGTMKYRIFSAGGSDASLRVTFVPINDDGKFGDQKNWSNNVYALTGEGNAAKFWQKKAFYGMGNGKCHINAIEKAFISGQSYLDVSVPFVTHLNFMLIDKIIGFMYAESTSHLEVYEAFGDDVHLGVFCGFQGTYYDGVQDDAGLKKPDYNLFTYRVKGGEI